MKRTLCVAALGAATLAGLYGGRTLACTIDGKPSLTIDGHAVALNKVVPRLGSNLQLWAPFVFPVALQAGRKETLTEIKRLIPLQAEAFRTPWRWNFGDGSPLLHGFSVTHVFRHPGLYKVTVDAYFPSHKFWYTFDAVQVRVVKG
jgi:hypothetical protein